MIIKHLITSRLPNRINLEKLQAMLDSQIGEGIAVLARWNEDLTPHSIQFEFEDSLGYSAEQIEDLIQSHTIASNEICEVEKAEQSALAARQEVETLQEMLASYNNLLTRLEALEAQVLKG